jgi:hypothetical protein
LPYLDHSRTRSNIRKTKRANIDFCRFLKRGKISRELLRAHVCMPKTHENGEAKNMAEAPEQHGLKLPEPWPFAKGDTI